MLAPPISIDSLRRSRFQGGGAVVPYKRQPAVSTQPAKSISVEVIAAAPQPPQDNELIRQLAPSLAAVLRPAGASRWLMPSVAAITPQYVEATLRGALAGNHVQAWELFDLMIDTDPEIASCCGEYVSGVISKPVVVKAYADEDEEPTPEAKQKAAVVSACIRNMRPDMANDENDLNSSIKDILFARFHGQSILEVDWYKKDGSGLNVKQFNNTGAVVVPRSTFWVHPVCYAWDMNGRLGLRNALRGQLNQAVNKNKTASGSVMKNLSMDVRRSMVEPPAWNWISSEARPSDLIDFPDNKFLIGLDKFKSGTIMGSGSVLRTLAWWWVASMFCGDWLLNYAQLFGIPFRKATCSPSTSEGKKQEIRQMLQSMGSQGYILLDSGNNVEFERAGSGAGDSPQAFLFHFANEMKRKVILRQTMTGGSSSGSVGIGKGFGETEAEGPKEQCLQAGATYVESVLNLQLVPYICNVNFGEGGDLNAPTIKLVDQERGNLEDAQIAAIASKLINIPAGYLRQMFGYPEAGPDDTIAGIDEGIQPPTPGGEAAPEGGSSGSQGAAPVESRNAKPVRAAAPTATAAVSKAAAETVAPLTDRLKAIDAIQDTAVKKDALQKLLADLPKITAALKHNPSLSEAVAKAIMPKGKQ